MFCSYSIWACITFKHNAGAEDIHVCAVIACLGLLSVHSRSLFLPGHRVWPLCFEWLCGSSLYSPTGWGRQLEGQKWEKLMSQDKDRLISEEKHNIKTKQCKQNYWPPPTSRLMSTQLLSGSRVKNRRSCPYASATEFSALVLVINVNHSTLQGAMKKFNFIPTRSSTAS